MRGNGSREDESERVSNANTVGEKEREIVSERHKIDIERREMDERDRER